MKHICLLIIERLRELSNKTVEYGYIDDLAFGNNLLLDDRFLVSMDNLSSETIAINHRKQKERTINVKYIKFNNIDNNNLEDIINVERILDNLTKDYSIIERVVNMDYDYDIEYEKDNANDLLGVLVIDIKLKIKERQEMYGY